MVADGQYACCQLHRHQQRQHRATLAPWSLAWWRDARGSGTAPLSRTRTHAHTHTLTSSVARNLWGIGLPLLLALGLTHRHESRGPTGRRGGHGGGQEGSSLERGWGGTPWERETTPHTGRDTDGRTAAGGRGERERERYQVVEAFELRAVTLHSPHGLHARAHTHTHGRSRGCVWRDASSLTLITAQSSAVIAYFH